MTPLPGFCTGTRLMTAFSKIAGAFYPSGCIWAPANYTPQFQPHLHNMAGQYSHIVSIAPYLSRIFDGRTSKCTLETSWSTSTQCKFCTNKIWKLKTPFSSVLQNHRQKFTSPFSIVQVTNVEIHHAVQQLLTFDQCGLVNPAAYVVAVQGRALNSQPLPITHVFQQLPPLVWAVCAAKANLYACVVYLHTRQGQWQSNFESSYHTAKVSTEFWPHDAVSCEFWQLTICHPSTLSEGNSAPIVWHFSFWFCN